MKRTGKKARDYRVTIFLILFLAIILTIALSVVTYPQKMKKMFVQSSVESMERKLNDASTFTNENIRVNYEEIYLLTGLVSKYLDGTEEYSQNVLDIMEETRIKTGFENIGIIKKDSGQLFATLSNGKKVQLDIWTMDIDLNEDNISVELQTSPFSTTEEGLDKVVYRYAFTDQTGTTYLLIAEKSQETLKSILNVEGNEDGLVLVVRDNGNVVYGNGKIDEQNVVSYNVFALLEKLGASEDKIAEIENQFGQEEAGKFVLQVDKEPYYFVFHKIQNTNWICLNAYSETAMAGKNLGTVNFETMKLVMMVAIILLITLLLSVYSASSHIKKESEQKALYREKLFEEMSRHIPSSFAIICEGNTKPSFISHNFEEVIKEGDFDYSIENFSKWAGVEINEDSKEKFLETGRYEDIVQKGELFYAFGVYSIGVVDDDFYYVLTFEDVTSDIRAKHLLEDSIKRADEASKSKTQFLSKMSHEIRTPLNSIIGFSTIAMDTWNDTEKEELREYMGKIQASGNYLLELVSDILEISRIEEGRMEISKSPKALDELVDEVVSSFQGQMENKNIQFVVDKSYHNIVLNMDAFHIKQILNNLISNAYKYTEEGGCVGFEICGNQLDQERMSVQFIIQDTGIGMTPEFVQKIFEPFTQEDRGVRMKKQLRGSGLGMSICKNLVELLDGKIKVESEVGEGSCFTVQLTLEIADAEVSNRLSTKNTDYTCLEGKKILVVDDIEMNRMVVEKFLSVYKMEFAEAEDGQQAVKRFEESEPDEFFAIFMDVKMPVMDGYQATEAIRKLGKKNAKTIPIIGMTADAFSDDVNKALMSGMNYHVAKPIQIQKVLDVLMEIYEEKR